MRYSRKQYVDAYQFTGDQLEVFIAISNDNTHIDKKGRLQFYINKNKIQKIYSEISYKWLNYWQILLNLRNKLNFLKSIYSRYSIFD